MKTYRYAAWGGPSVLSLDDIDLPNPPAGRVRVRMAVVGINPADWKTISGKYKVLCTGPFPRLAGIEGAGVITAVGPGVKGWSVGQRVLVSNNPPDGTSGSWAEEANIKASRLFAMREGLKMRDGAVLPIAGLTAFQMCRFTRVKPGSRVLITGGSGGVGSFAVQIAKALGAHVAAVGSAGNRERILALGADEFIDYRTTPPERMPTGWDAIIDCVVSLRAQSGTLLRAGGRYIDTEPLPMNMLKDSFSGLFGGPRRSTVMVGMDQPGMATLMDMVIAGKVRPQIGAEHAFADMRQVLEQAMSGHNVGKNVVWVSADRSQ